MNEIELWESEIDIENKYQESIKEDTIYDFTDSEPVQEVTLGAALASIGVFILANLLLVAALLISAAADNKRRKVNKEDISKNPKSKALIDKALQNLQEFVYKNLPSDLKKYAVKRSAIDIDETSKNGKTIRKYAIVEFDIDKLVKGLVDSKCKNVEDLYTIEFRKEDDTDEDFKNICENPDTFIDINGKGNNADYSKYSDFIYKVYDFIDELNKKVKKIPTKYNANIKFIFDGLGGSISIDQCPYIGVSFDIPSATSISSFTEDELEEIEKVAKVKLPTNESVYNF